MPMVISHRAAFPASAITNDRSSQVATLLPPGSIKSLEALKSRGVCAFDVDVFATLDSQLVVGHPDEVKRRLHLTSLPSSMTLSQLRKLDGGQTATVEEFLSAAAECEKAGDNRIRVLLELKGSSATKKSLEAISSSVTNSNLGPGETGV